MVLRQVLFSMRNNKPFEKIIHYSLGILLLVFAANAFFGGYYALSDTNTIPTEWLKGSPFHNYFIPGLFLFIVIGGSALNAAILVFKRRAVARKAAFVSGIVILLWLAVQVAIIGYVSWMQPTTAVAAFIVLLLTLQLPKYGN